MREYNFSNLSLVSKLQVWHPINSVLLNVFQQVNHERHPKDQAGFLGNFIKNRPKNPNHKADSSGPVTDDEWEHLYTEAFIYSTSPMSYMLQLNGTHLTAKEVRAQNSNLSQGTALVKYKRT